MSQTDTMDRVQLTSKQRRYLRSLAHHLNPLVQTGKAGVTSELVKQVDHSLEHHELIKVRILCDDREELKLVTDELVEATGAGLVQVVGHIAVLFRPSKEWPEIKLP